MDAPTAPIINYDDLEPRLATGDVLIFHGTDIKGSIPIQTDTQSGFSHAAMVIRPDPSKPPLVWQTGPGPIVVDAVTHASHGGAQISLLRDALVYMSNPLYGDTGYVRQLQFARSPEFETVAMWAISGLDGTPFSTMDDMQKFYSDGQRHLAVSDQTFFCSELAAHTFMLLGLLPFDPPANAYSPGRFSPEYGNLPWLRGATLGPLMQINPPLATTPIPPPATERAAVAPSA